MHIEESTSEGTGGENSRDRENPTNDCENNEDLCVQVDVLVKKFERISQNIKHCIETSNSNRSSSNRIPKPLAISHSDRGNKRSFEQEREGCADSDNPTLRDWYLFHIPTIHI